MTHTPMTYRIYDELKNHIGKENAISGLALSTMFGITERNLRGYIHQIRNSTELTRIVGSNSQGYFLCKDEDFDEVDKRLERQALSTLKVCLANRRKRAKDGQYKMPLGDYYQEIYHALSQEE